MAAARSTAASCWLPGQPQSRAAPRSGPLPSRGGASASPTWSRSRALSRPPRGDHAAPRLLVGRPPGGAPGRGALRSLGNRRAHRPRRARAGRDPAPVRASSMPRPEDTYTRRSRADSSRRPGLALLRLARGIVTAPRRDPPPSERDDEPATRGQLLPASIDPARGDVGEAPAPRATSSRRWRGPGGAERGRDVDLARGTCALSRRGRGAPRAAPRGKSPDNLDTQYEAARGRCGSRSRSPPGR